MDLNLDVSTNCKKFTGSEEESDDDDFSFTKRKNGKFKKIFDSDDEEKPSNGKPKGKFYSF